MQHMVRIILLIILLAISACSSPKNTQGLAGTRWEWQKAVYSDGITYEPYAVIDTPYLHFTNIPAANRNSGLVYHASMGCGVQGGGYVLGNNGRIDLLESDITSKTWDADCQPIEHIQNDFRWIEAHPIIRRYERIDDTLRLYSDNLDVFVFSLKAVDTKADESTLWGPMVISNNPNATITRWRYTSPYALDGDDSVSNYPGTVPVGMSNQNTYIIWYDGGFYLTWDGFYCAREPILLISESNMALWKNEAVFIDCEASEGKHMFEVELETTTPQDEWTFSIERTAP